MGDQKMVILLKTLKVKFLKISFFIINRLSNMLSQRKKLQTSSEPKRTYKYMLPLSKPKLIAEQNSFRNISSEADRTFTSTSGRINFSLKSLNTYRACPKPSMKLQTEHTKRDQDFIHVMNRRREKSKIEIILCLQNKEIEVNLCANTVQQLTYEIKRYLKNNKFNYKFKTIESIDDNLPLNYLLSIPDIELKGLIYKRIKIRPYYGVNQIQINIQSFQIIKAIGSGGFSTVYLVRYKADGKFYAMKVLSKSFISKHKKQKLVMNQRYVMKSIDHPFLAKLHWSFQSKNYLIFILDYYPGGELFEVLKKYKRMSEGMARYYITQILLGLEGLHNQGIAYRDLKPENILIDKDGHACISDFGLVKLGLKDPECRTFSFCGSPQYMSPEVVSRKGHSIVADFYSLGALLFQLLTGLPPFYNRNPEEIYKGTLNGSLSIPSFLSENVKDLLLKLLAKSQVHRLGAKNGVADIFQHPWFDKIDKNLFLKKKVIPPISFQSIQDLSFNEAEMKKSNSQCIKNMLKQQSQDDKFPIMLSDFKFNRKTCNEQLKENRQDSQQITPLIVSRMKTKKSMNSSISFERFKIYDNFL